MTEECVRLETARDDRGSASVIPIRWFSDRSRSSISVSHTLPLDPLGPHTEAAEDLLAIAVAAYCADRSITREDQDDGWTRHITLDVPVRRPERWDSDLLRRVLSTLTGDHWNIELRRGQPHPGLRNSDADPAAVDATALFSGGVDSLAWASELHSSAEAMALVSHFGDGPTGKLQANLAKQLGARRHYGFRLQRTGSEGREGWPDSDTQTTRSRSFLFLALGLLIARTHRSALLRMPENGYIAVNVPLHAGRIGSLSTRSAHPEFVDRLNKVIATADLGARVENPYLFMTKGEVSERLLGCAPHLAWSSVSCAHPTAGRWRRLPFGHCGYCYPCIIRRAGFNHAGEDRTRYGSDPLGDSSFYEAGTGQADIRSIARFLLDPVEVTDIRATGRIGTTEAAEILHQMVRRGQDEIRRLFAARATPEVRARLGL